MTSKPWVTLTLASISCLLLLYHLLSPWSIINVNISLALQWCSTQLSVACSKAKSLTDTMESMMAQSFQGTWEHGLLHHSVALDGKSCIDTTIRSSLQWRSKSSQAYMSIVELTLYRIASSVSSRSVVSMCWEDRLVLQSYWAWRKCDGLLPCWWSEGCTAFFLLWWTALNTHHHNYLCPVEVPFFHFPYFH